MYDKCTCPFHNVSLGLHVQSDRPYVAFLLFLPELFCEVHREQSRTEAGLIAVMYCN